MSKVIATVPVYDELESGQAVRIPIGSDIVGARRDPNTGVLQLVVIAGVTATQPMTVGIHVVNDTTGYVPERGRYLATIDGPGQAAHVFVTAHRAGSGA